jgi:hypothetical protein
MAKTYIRNFGSRRIRTTSILGDGNCHLRAIYHQRLRTSTSFAEENVRALIRQDRQAIHRHISENLDKFQLALQFNGEEMKVDDDEELEVGAF